MSTLRDLTLDEVQRIKKAAANKVPGFEKIDPANVMADESSQLYAKPPQGIVDSSLEGAGRIARQAAFSAPSAIAGRLAAIGTGAAGGAIAGPPGAIIGGIAGALGGPMVLRKFVQDPLENLIVEKFPTSAISEQIQKSRADRAAHPYQSLAGDLLTAPLAGGGYNVLQAAKQGAKRLAAGAGILTGVNIAGQKMAGEDVDLPLAAAAGIGGALTSAPMAGFRTFERGLMKYLPENAINKIAPNIEMPSSALSEVPKPVKNFPHSATDYNPDFLLGTDPANLSKLGKFEQTIANLRKQNIPLSPEDLVSLSQEGSTQGWDVAAANMTRRKLPMLEGQAAPDAEVKRRLEQAEISTPKKAALTGDAIKEADAATTERLSAANEANTKQLQKIQNAEAVKNAAEGQANYPTSGKPAAESAQAIMSRETQVKNLNKELSSLASEARTIKALQKHIESLPEDTTNLQDLHSMLAEMQGVHNEKRIDLLRRSESILPGGKGLQEFPGEVGEDVAAPVSPVAKAGQPETPAIKPIVTQPPSTTKTVIANKETPLPETPDTIQEQLKLLREGTKKAVLLPKGTKMPPLQQGEQTTFTTKGTFIHKGDISSDALIKAARQNKVGEILGYGIAEKPPGANVAVSVVKPSGTPVQDVLTTKETLPQVVEAAEKVAKPGDTIEAKPGMKVLEKRLETPQVKKGDVITRGNTDYTVEQVGMKGLISAKSKRGHIITVRPEDLNRELAAGQSSITPAAEGADTGVILNLLDSPSGLGKTARLAVREDSGFYQAMKDAALSGKKMNEADYFKSLPPEKQVQITQKYIDSVSKEPRKGINIKLGSKEAGFTLNPAKILEAFKPDLEDIKKNFGVIGNRFAKRAEEMVIRRAQIDNPLQDHINKADAGLTPAETKKIQDYLYDISDKGSSDNVLPPELAVRAKALQDVVNATGAQKLNGPLVTDFDEKGNQIQRPFDARPGYMPQDLKPEIWKTLRTGTPEEIAPIRQRMVEYLMEKKGINKDVAEKIFVSKYLGGDFTTRTTASPEFQGLRYAEGVGIPPEFRRNIFDTIKRYVNRHAADLAYHETVETDPVIGKALGLEDNGKGQAYPDLPEGFNVESGSLANRAKAIFRDYVGIVSPESQAFERWNRLANTLAIQTVSQTRDILASPAIFAEFMSPAEARFIPKAIKDVFAPEVKNQAIRAGAVRPFRNMAQATALDAEDAINHLTDLIQKGTGSEALNVGQRIFNYSLGKQIARNRLLKGDNEFFDKWGPFRWQEWEPDKLTDYVATRINNNIVGTHDFQNLPSWVTKGSQSGWKPLFSLARWSIERANRWKENVFEPAKKGNIYPLIGSLTGAVLSAEAVNWLTEAILKRKPQELTMEEYLKLGGKDTANTLLSKLAITGYAGILTDGAVAALKASRGEMPRGFNNLLFVSAENLTTRLAQFLSALNDGTATIADLPLIMSEALRDNIQIVRMFTPKEDTTGAREERLAERLGYTPQSGGVLKYPLANPFSLNQIYKREDLPMLQRKIAKDIEEGREPRGPSSALPKEGVYQFIREAQGPEAEKAARARDKENVLKNNQTYANAVRGLFSR